MRVELQLELKLELELELKLEVELDVGRLWSDDGIEAGWLFYIGAIFSLREDCDLVSD